MGSTAPQPIESFNHRILRETEDVHFPLIAALGFRLSPKLFPNPLPARWPAAGDGERVQPQPDDSWDHGRF